MIGPVDSKESATRAEKAKGLCRRGGVKNYFRYYLFRRRVLFAVQIKKSIESVECMQLYREITVNSVCVPMNFVVCVIPFAE